MSQAHENMCDVLAVPMRVGEVSYRVQEVKLGLYASNSMFQPKAEVSAAILVTRADHRHRQCAARMGTRFASVHGKGNSSHCAAAGNLYIALPTR